MSDGSEAAAGPASDGPPAPRGPIRLREGIVSREIDGEIVLLDLEGSSYFSVGRSGVPLWPLVVEGTTPQALADCLIERFSIERDVAERDVRSFLDSLSAEKLI